VDLPEVSRLAQWDIECAVRDIPFHSHTPISAASEWGSQWRRSKVRLHLRWQFLHPHKFRVGHDLPWREIAGMRIDVSDLRAATEFLRALDQVLSAPSIVPSQFNDYLRAVKNLPSSGKTGPAKWTVATIFPYLAQPDRFMFLKPVSGRARSSSTPTAAAVNPIRRCGN